jgi:signal transduction histidine kinase
MDYLQKLIRRAQIGLFIIILIDNAVLIGGWWLGNKVLGLNALELIGFLAVLALVATSLIATSVGKYLMQPVQALWQTILHLTPGAESVAAPQPQSLRFGGELVTNLSSHIYELVSLAEQAASKDQQQATNMENNFVAQNLPLPFLLLDPTEMITFANKAAADYVGIKATDMVGKNVYMVLDMSFPSDATFDKWLKDSKTHAATASNTWERVRLNVRDSHPTRLFDLAAFYNRDNPARVETMLVLFDHNKQYSQDDQAISFIALSVHELRTPLTLLRGYIEVFEEELGDKMTQTDPEMQTFLLKMRAMAEQLTAFVNNILNVARVDDDQLELQLQQEDWATILRSTIEAISLRAKVRDITLECSIAKDLPPVGVDRLSIREVINNLVDNAIKYSGSSKLIKIDSRLTPDGLVETTVQDSGLGIPANIMPNLFTKFYRDHRNRAQIGGTGLGLYLCKAIVTAHGGNLWVRSREGRGSTFGFTLLPYVRLTEELKRSGNQEITRSAHGWIKNHSLYRR